MLRKHKHMLDSHLGNANVIEDSIELKKGVRLFKSAPKTCWAKDSQIRACQGG